MPIPSLHAKPTEAELNDSAKLYNTLPYGGDQRQVPEAHLQEILQLILTNGVKDKFGVHLIHGHLQIGKGEVMFGKALTNANARGIWTRPTSITELDLSNIHGHIFVLSSDCRFTAYEYREGPPPAMNSNDNIFIAQFAKFLQKHGLTDLLGLQVLAGYRAKMQEFDLSGSGPEGWSTEADKTTGIIELKGNDVHAPMQNGNHRLFQDSKLTDEESRLNVLKREAIILVPSVGLTE
ncbi:hypothetical protein F4818DRAFT_442335 [Hypoxylon cercidicola]|nr:hypothetical protein F4818DRAFT_442335 [Hypoxylon cercidicola]